MIQKAFGGEFALMAEVDDYHGDLIVRVVLMVGMLAEIKLTLSEFGTLFAGGRWINMYDQLHVSAGSATARLSFTLYKPASFEPVPF
jgi:hypothetical protein